jgi:hypothetical protein
MACQEELNVERHIIIRRRLQDKEEREKLTKQLERVWEEKSIQERQLTKYRKAYPRFPDMEEEEADDQDQLSKLDGQVNESVTQTTAYKTTLEKKLASCSKENETPQHMMNEEEKAVFGGELESEDEKKCKDRVSLEDHPLGCLISTQPTKWRKEMMTTRQSD